MSWSYFLFAGKKVEVVEKGAPVHCEIRSKAHDADFVVTFMFW